MDFSTFKRELVIHYAEMAALPWAVEQAQHSVAELVRNYPAEFGDLRELLRAEIKARRRNAADH